jgi:hypothetical protein
MGKSKELFAVMRMETEIHLEEGTESVIDTLGCYAFIPVYDKFKIAEKYSEGGKFQIVKVRKII